MKVVRIAGFLTLLALVAALPAAGQSLAEAARKEKERQQAAQKSGKAVKTYTSEDLAKRQAAAGTASTTASTPAPAGTTPTGPAAPTATAPAGKTAEGGEAPEQVEKKWVEKYKALKTEIAQKRQRIQALRNELNQLTTGLMGAWSPEQSQALRNEIARRQEEIRKLEEETRAKETELDRVVRDARREGVPPGAFRKADRELESAGSPKP